MSKTIIVTAYTPDYADHAWRLRSSIATVGGHCHAVALPEYPPEHRWQIATAQKPLVILDALWRFRRPVLWIDADAVVWQDVREYFDAIRGDVAAHWYDQDAVDGTSKHPNGRMLTGTLWINFSERALRLMSAWIARNYRKQMAGDWTGGGQRNLWESLEEAGPISMHRLPGRYCYIDFADKRRAYDPTEPKLIEHFIASRVHREPGKTRDSAKLIEHRQAVANAAAQLGV